MEEISEETVYDQELIASAKSSLIMIGCSGVVGVVSKAERIVSMPKM